MNNPFLLCGQTIPYGSKKTIEIEIARLPSGTLIHMQVHVFRGPEEGPVVLLSGGLHGDEINGVEIVRRIVNHSYLDNLQRGTIIAIPIINVYGFIQFSREVPDGKDVNRSFPGNQEGSLAGIVAHTLTDQILPYIDFGIDFHTGGASRSNYPQIRFDPSSEKARELSEQFNAPLMFASPLIDGSLRFEAARNKTPILVFEGGESMRFDQFAISEGIRGAMMVLKSQNMLDIEMELELRPCLELHENQWIRADASGLFKAMVKGGQHLAEGQLMGQISSPYGNYEMEVFSPIEGVVISHNNLPLVHKGDALFQVGKIK